MHCLLKKSELPNVQERGENVLDETVAYKSTVSRGKLAEIVPYVYANEQSTLVLYRGLVSWLMSHNDLYQFVCNV